MNLVNNNELYDFVLNKNHILVHNVILVHRGEFFLCKKELDPKPKLGSKNKI